MTKKCLLVYLIYLFSSFLYQWDLLSGSKTLKGQAHVDDEGEERALGTECLCPHSPPPPNSYVEVPALSRQGLQEAMRS